MMRKTNSKKTSTLWLDYLEMQHNEWILAKFPRWENEKKTDKWKVAQTEETDEEAATGTTKDFNLIREIIFVANGKTFFLQRIYHGIRHYGLTILLFDWIFLQPKSLCSPFLYLTNRYYISWTWSRQGKLLLSNLLTRIRLSMEDKSIHKAIQEFLGRKIEKDVSWQSWLGTDKST